MITWDTFIYFAFASLFCWMGAVGCAYVPNLRRWTVPLMSLGLAIFAVFLIGFWIVLERPPLRTMGETRLWYSFFLSVVGLITYLKWRYRWILLYSTVLSGVFIFINLFKPEIHSKSLMPALQSPWFAPHVIVYMFAYALLGCSFLMALYVLYSVYKKNKDPQPLLSVTDNMVYAGFAFMTIGMLFGALWAKEAWGHYWSWDPKETWAAVTWLAYLLYIHLRWYAPRYVKETCILLIVSFLFLQMCWYGVNYLPAAQQSIHRYSMS